MHIILVHGGAGRWPTDRHAAARAGVRRAAATGQAVLSGGGSALEAVVRAVHDLEDDPTFNAGTGSSLTIDGRAEMDAGVMDGTRLAAGAVANLEGVRHPVAAARRVMEATDHVLLAGEGARRFARSQGFAEYNPVTAAARERWQRLRQKLGEGEEPLPRLSALIRSHPELAGGDTVGAVARDHTGALAAATSTGGIMLRLSGRVGDTPLPGAGTYADDHCAVSATGWGELMMRFGTARALAAAVANGDPLDSAAASLLREMAERVGTEAGLIAIDRTGVPGIAHGTPHLPHAYAGTGMSGIRAAMTKENPGSP